MKRGAPLTRSTPMTRTPFPRPPASTSGAGQRTRVAFRSRPVVRDWRGARAKVAAEGRCRVCGGTERLEAAHVIGREHDGPRPGQAGLWVNHLHVVPLCAECHRGPDGYDHHGINLLPHLADAEWAAAVALVGEGRAKRRVMGSAWRTTGARP